jgi:Holliday junction DNA helicase RuvB
MANPNLTSNKEQMNLADKEFENTIRPKELDDFSGQPQLVENLIIFV